MRKGKLVTDIDLKLETYGKGNKSYWVEQRNIFGIVTYSGMCKAAIVGYNLKGIPTIFCRFIRRQQAVTIAGQVDLSYFFKYKMGSLRFYRPDIVPELIGLE